MNAEVELNNITVKALPEDAIVKWQNKDYVFVKTAELIYKLVPVVTGENTNGYIDIGTKNKDWGHIYTDRPKFALNKDLVDTQNLNADLKYEFFSDKKTFRANAVSESMDQQTAKNKSMIEAKQKLASFINTTIKSTLDNYVKDNEHNKKEDIEKKYEGLTREVVNQKLSGIRVICDKLTKTPEGNYKSYVALELGADDLVQAINDRLTKEESLKVDYDYEKFKKTFEEEMNKMK